MRNCGWLVFPSQITASLTPGGKSAIPKKTGAGIKNSVVGVQRRNTFGYGDSAGGSGTGPRATTPGTDAANKKPGVSTPGASNAGADIRRWVCGVVRE